MAKKDNHFSQLNGADQVLQSLLQGGKSPLAEQYIRWKLWRNWEKVLGSEIARHTLPVSYVKGTLYIWVNSAARLQELTFLLRPMREKINKFAGKNWAQSLRFTLDRKSVPQPEESPEEMREFLDRQENPPEESERG